jgi:hypothetical protein
MTEEPDRVDTQSSGGDRRTGERRRTERRAPLPLWRRPWALVAYRVLGTLLIVAVINRSRPAAETPALDREATPDGTGGSGVPAPVSMAAPEEARSPAHLERLLAEGEAARGRYLRVELYCSTLGQVSLRTAEYVEPAVSEVRDGSNRVPAAECKWGSRQGDEPRGDVLLIVPPELVTAFAAAPSVDDGFITRRRVEGVVEWLGRPESLALRYSVVLREYPIAPAA